MYCPKCGTENSGNVRFCRKCGGDIETVAGLISGKLTVNRSDTGSKGFWSSASWEKALLFLSLGVALLITGFITGFDYITGFPTPFLALVILAFPLIGLGAAQILRITASGKEIVVAPADSAREIASGQHKGLPESRTDYVSPEDTEDFRTADLVPSSVTENTTRHLEMEESDPPDRAGSADKDG